MQVPKTLQTLQQALVAQAEQRREQIRDQNYTVYTPTPTSPTDTYTPNSTSVAEFSNLSQQEQLRLLATRGQSGERAQRGADLLFVSDLRTKVRAFVSALKGALKRKRYTPVPDRGYSQQDQSRARAIFQQHKDEPLARHPSGHGSIPSTYLIMSSYQKQADRLVARLQQKNQRLQARGQGPQPPTGSTTVQPLPTGSATQFPGGSLTPPPGAPNPRPFNLFPPGWLKLPPGSLKPKPQITLFQPGWLKLPPGSLKSRQQAISFPPGSLKF